MIPTDHAQAIRGSMESAKKTCREIFSISCAQERISLSYCRQTRAGRALPRVHSVVNKCGLPVYVNELATVVGRTMVTTLATFDAQCLGQSQLQRKVPLFWRNPNYLPTRTIMYDAPCLQSSRCVRPFRQNTGFRRFVTNRLTDAGPQLGLYYCVTIANALE